MEQSETTMVSSSNVQLYPEERLGLGTQQDSPDRYSYGGANSHRSCADQGDHWGPNQDVNPMRELWRRGSEMEMKLSLFNCAWMRAHGTWWLFSDLEVFKSRRRL